ncbi:hypothetical protein [Micromonospora endophytica]|uniref:Uncharacterized protein n=2 Tax=Micromonospora endophytica TaxID=515350 RepID=A0A2W2D3V5_9ACTN|nr:hypothetical protein [Micromonospora endophytica]PZG00275.1 hypothetical protein C1I93_03185 [Micromonospora endophytica]
MSELKWDLPSEISNSTLRRVQRSLDRDFRVAIDNNRAERRPGHELAGGLRAPNTRGLTRQIRADTASLVDERLRESWFGRARVAFNWLLRQVRRRQGDARASTPDDRADYPAYGEQRQAARADYPAYGEQRQAARADYPAYGEQRQAARADYPDYGEQQQAPFARADYPVGGEKPRAPITQEQVERWMRVLHTQQLDPYEQRFLRSAVAAAYLVQHNPDLHQLYRKDPREMQNLAQIVAAADGTADRYQPRPVPRRVPAPPQNTFDFGYGYGQPIPSAPPSPLTPYAIPEPPLRYVGTEPTTRYVSPEPSTRYGTPEPSTRYVSPEPPGETTPWSAPARRYTSAESDAMLPSARDGSAPHDPTPSWRHTAHLTSISRTVRESPAGPDSYTLPVMPRADQSRSARRGRK